MVNTLNPTPALIRKFFREGKLIVTAPDGKIEYLFFPTDATPARVMVAYRFPNNEYRAAAKFGDESIAGWVNGNSWGLLDRYDSPGSCTCSDCIALFPLTQRRKASKHAKEHTISAVLNIIFAGVQLWKFQCGMKISSAGPSNRALLQF